MIRRAGLGAAWMSVALAVAAMLVLSFWGFYTNGNTVVEENGNGVLIILSLPVVVAVMGLLAASWRTTPGGFALWVLAIGLSFFCLVTIFSVGMFYAPSALALLLSAALVGRPVFSDGRP
jgi:hypothetical protein